MKINNDDQTSDELIALLEASGIALSDADKAAIRRHERSQKLMRESMGEDYQRSQIVGLCRRLGRSGRTLIQQSLNSYLTVCRRSARGERGKIDIFAIYASRNSRSY